MFKYIIDIYNTPYKLFCFAFIISFVLLSIESRINKRQISFKDCLKISFLSACVSMIIIYFNHFIINNKNTVQTNYDNVILSNTNFN